MKNFIFKAMVFMTVLQSCGSTNVESEGVIQDTKHYNICLIRDGTDRLSEQNDVPVVTSEEIAELAKVLSNKGVGYLYVSYIDNNCDNNHVAIFEWLENKPGTVGEKPDYMKMEAYKKLEREDFNNMEAYNKRKEKVLDMFSTEINTVVVSAYSDIVAKQRKGSDVSGAVNKAIRLLKASEQDSAYSHIILVSDGCDNVGKELAEFPHNTELIIVNSNVSKHQYGKLVSKEFVTMKQALNYIFK